MTDPLLATTPLPRTSGDTAAGSAHPATWNLNAGGPAATQGLAAVPDLSADLDPLAEALRTMPAVGESAFGFVLLQEIGQGTFGKVYLAMQPELADRWVVLKISVDLTGETRALAQLQHTNIVPIYSVHRGPRHQAVCMPYFGSTTLARLLRHYREEKSLPVSGQQFVQSFRSLSARETGPQRPVDAESPSASTEQLRAILAAGSYPRAVAWLAARLADGLAHAHERGFLHRDIKPANILLTDDGQPMLLDFGLAEELARRASAGEGVIGGTLAYMAPEHLDEVRTRRPSAVPASDLFSLGVVLYELLTGQFPYTVLENSALMAEERRKGPPPVRTLNPEVTPGLEAIVHLCLAARPEDRYPSATALRDDLDHYLADRPLKTAPEPSVAERVRKWSRRHPRLTSVTSLLIAGTILAVGVATGLLEKRAKLRRLEAEQVFREFAVESKAAQLTLYAKPEDDAALEKGGEQGRAAVARYRATDPDWEASPLFKHLPAEQQLTLRRELAETYLLLARASWFRATRTARPDPDGVAEAIAFNAVAERLVPDDPSRLVFIQRKTMFTALGRPADAATADAALARHPPRTARDFYSEAQQAYTAGQHAAAAGWYRKAQEADPKAFWPHFGEGACRIIAGEWAAARGCFTAALVIDPDSTDARANRALANLRLGDAAAAEVDATAALAVQPTRTDALLVRAEARGLLKLFEPALADAEEALKHGATAALTLRDSLREKAGLTDPAGDPDTAAGWVRRGQKLIKADNDAALTAFEKALELNPQSVSALLHKGYVLGVANRDAECEAVYSRAVAIEPKNTYALVGRAVMRARLKRDAEAVADARAALGLTFSPIIVYQAAGVFARVSARQPEYADEALVLLRIALRAGAGFEHLDTDPELDPLRGTPAFEKILADAKKARPIPPK